MNRVNTTIPTHLQTDSCASLSTTHIQTDSAHGRICSWEWIGEFKGAVNLWSNPFETSSQRWLGMDKGCNRPEVLIVSTLFCWQTKHSATILWISDLRSSQKKSFLTLWYVFKNPKCPPKGEVFNSKRIFFLRWEFLQRYKWSLYHNESFFQLNVSDVLGYCCNFWMSIYTSSSFFHSSLS